ncbi:hypothetical protein N7U49_46215 [Streptomyces sp. AD2-2]|nr:hypothetical protein N7U49_46215 [Streptomyces sp. AD2-2]
MGIVEERHQTPRQNTPAGPVALGAAVGFCIWAQAGLVVNRAGSLAQLTLPRPILPLTQLVSWVALTAAVGAGTAMVAPSKDTPAAAAGARAALLGQVIGLISALFANGARHSQPQGPSLEPNSRELAHFSRRVGGGALGGAAAAVLQIQRFPRVQLAARTNILGPVEARVTVARRTSR